MKQLGAIPAGQTVNNDFFKQKVITAQDTAHRWIAIFSWMVQLKGSNPTLTKEQIYQIVNHTLASYAALYNSDLTNAYQHFSAVEHLCCKSLYSATDIPTEQVKLFPSKDWGLFPGITTSIDNIAETFGILENVEAPAQSLTISPELQNAVNAFLQSSAFAYNLDIIITRTIDHIASRINVILTEPIANTNKAIDQFLTLYPNARSLIIQAIKEHISKMITAKTNYQSARSKRDTITQAILETIPVLSESGDKAPNVAQKSFKDMSWQEKADRSGKTIVVLLLQNDGSIKEEKTIYPISNKVNNNNVIFIHSAKFPAKYQVVVPLWQLYN